MVTALKADLQGFFSLEASLGEANSTGLVITATESGSKVPMHSPSAAHNAPAAEDTNLNGNGC
jgi:hypothetical protein